MSPREGLALRLRQAFLDHGYEQLTMSGLAQVCGLTRRALYHHFSNKEEAFRFVLRHDGGVITHVIDHAHKAVIEHLDGVIEDFFQRW